MNKEKVINEYKKYEENKFKEEMGIIDEGNIVPDESLEGDKDE